MPFFVVVGGHCRPDKPFLKSIECFDPRVGRCDKVGAVLKEGMIEASAAELAGKFALAVDTMKTTWNSALSKCLSFIYRFVNSIKASKPIFSVSSIIHHFNTNTTNILKQFIQIRTTRRSIDRRTPNELSSLQFFPSLRRRMFVGNRR